MWIERLLVRPLRAGDEPKVQRMRKALWPDNSDEDNEHEVAAYVRGTPPEPLGGALFVCELPDSGIVGFCEASLRSYAEGCDPSRPVGYIEGWFVEPDHRRNGVGRALIQACEQWARERGCEEMGSDAEIDNTLSHRAHAALGYEEVERIVCFRKKIT